MTGRRVNLILAAAALSLAAVVLALAGCGPAAVPPAPPAAPASASASAPGSPHCGRERWSVKTGTDPAAANVDLHTVYPATVAALTRLPVPAGLSQDAARLVPVEDTVYRVTATLREYKLEADSDVHLVLADSQGRTMIAEIPAPACVGPGSPFQAAITTARAQFSARYHPGNFWQQAGVQVTVTGVGFFDSLHGQTGVASNGIELHPVLDVQFGQAS